MFDYFVGLALKGLNVLKNPFIVYFAPNFFHKLSFDITRVIKIIRDIQDIPQDQTVDI